MTKNELSLLLFLETRAVDHGGKVQTAHMNQADFDLADNWCEQGFVRFGRVRAKDITQQGGSHWVQLSPAAWEAAHAERKARAEGCGLSETGKLRKKRTLLEVPGE